MFDNRWILIDVNSLAHRAWHVLDQQITYKGKPTAVIFGFLRDLASFQENFATKNIVFCFDQGTPHRKEIYPNYKSNRIKDGKQSLYLQLNQLRSEVLSRIGFENIISEKGYEADDLIAHLVKTKFKKKEVIMVSRDHDLHQLITKDNRVVKYDPQTKACIGYEQFQEEWPGLDPKDLPTIMAMTGCVTDNIKGIKSVGPVTALAAFQGNEISDRINTLIREAAESGLIELNKKLVTLPWPGLVEPTLYKDSVTQEKWNAECRRWGMESLVPKCPMVS